MRSTTRTTKRRRRRATAMLSMAAMLLMASLGVGHTSPASAEIGACISGSAYLYVGGAGNACLVFNAADDIAIVTSADVGEGIGGGIAPSVLYSKGKTHGHLEGDYYRVAAGPVSYSQSLEAYCDGEKVGVWEFNIPSELSGSIGRGHTWVFGANDPSGLNPCIKHYPRIQPLADVQPGSWWSTSAYWAVDEGVITPDHKLVGVTSHNYFVPERLLSRKEVVYGIWVLEGSPSAGTTGPSPFSDVQDRTDPYYKAIMWASQASVTKGYPDGRFGPDDNVTRGQIVTFLHRAEGGPAADRPVIWNDVGIHDYFYAPVQWAAGRPGIARGDGQGNFNPHAPVQRRDGATFLHRYSTHKRTKYLTFCGEALCPDNRVG